MFDSFATAMEGTYAMEIQDVRGFNAALEYFSVPA